MTERKVGYRHPPEEHRFRGGKSGNPNGRPKGSLNFKGTLLDVLGEPTELRLGDKTHAVPKLKAVLMKLVDSAQGGNQRATETLLTLCANARLADDTDDAEDRDILDAVAATNRNDAI